MELIVFDLDGTLLDRSSRISAYTGDTLKLLAARGIAYTVATGRTRHGARVALGEHRFELPQAYKNGVMIWHPDREGFSSGAMLTSAEVSNVVTACDEQGLTPFLFTLSAEGSSSVYHPPFKTDVERKLVDSLGIDEDLTVRSLEDLPVAADITHVNAVGAPDAIINVMREIEEERHLVAYSGIAREGEQWRWLDIHHRDASKGGAIATLKELAGIDRVVCFGDNDNDLSMFAAADESYAPENATEQIKEQATGIIGHHDEDGVARYLRERFLLR